MDRDEGLPAAPARPDARWRRRPAPLGAVALTAQGLLALLALLAGCANVAGPARQVPASRPVGAAAGQTLRVVALNAGMLPGPFGTDNLRRAERICDHVLAEPGPDVIVLVEVFDEPARARFTRRLERTHPWIVRHAGGGRRLGEDSGLFVASRVPFLTAGPRTPAFEAFAARGPLTEADAWAAKGVLGLHLDGGPGGAGLCLFCTHLMADYRGPGQYAAVRERQLRQLARFAHRFLARGAPGPRAPALLVGDLNLPAEAPGADARAPSPEYARLARLLGGPVDLFRLSHPDAAGHTWNLDPKAPGADPAQPAQRLDYALLLGPGPGACAPLGLGGSAVATVPLPPGTSDHCALAVEVVLAGPADSASRWARASRHP